jgi:hypothetical protein
MSGFTRATQEQSLIRIAAAGPSGSGKSLNGLIMCSVFAQGEPFAVIDTERGSASKYASRYTFDVLELDDYSPDGYIRAMRAAEAGGYKALLIDSITPEWKGIGGILEIVEAERIRLKQNSAYPLGWKKGRAEHNKFVDALISLNLHLVVTMRSKMEYALSEDNGKKEVKKLGLEPVQSDDMSYEYDIFLDIDAEHNVIVAKSRFPEIADIVVNKPDEAFAQRILDLATTGAPRTPRPRIIPQNIQDRWFELRGMAIMRDMDMPEIDGELSDADIVKAGKEWAEKIAAYDAEKVAA